MEESLFEEVGERGARSKSQPSDRVHHSLHGLGRLQVHPRPLRPHPLNPLAKNTLVEAMNPQEQEQHAGHGHMNVKGVASSSHFPAPVSAVPNKEALEKIRVLLECEAACMNCADRAVEVGFKVS